MYIYPSFFFTSQGEKFNPLFERESVLRHCSSPLLTALGRIALFRESVKELFEKDPQLRRQNLRKIIIQNWKIYWKNEKEFIHQYFAGRPLALNRAHISCGTVLVLKYIGTSFLAHNVAELDQLQQHEIIALTPQAGLVGVLLYLPLFLL